MVGFGRNAPNLTNKQTKAGWQTQVECQTQLSTYCRSGWDVYIRRDGDTTASNARIWVRIQYRNPVQDRELANSGSDSGSCTGQVGHRSHSRAAAPACRPVAIATAVSEEQRLRPQHRRQKIYQSGEAHGGQTPLITPPSCGDIVSQMSTARTIGPACTVRGAQS